LSSRSEHDLAPHIEREDVAELNATSFSNAAHFFDSVRGEVLDYLFVPARV
jgi:hypothetical protein